jgi:hypothetical protein
LIIADTTSGQVCTRTCEECSIELASIGSLLCAARKGEEDRKDGQWVVADDMVIDGFEMRG